MSAATVITPWSWASPAIELANRTWKKRILPIGDIEYSGRTLHFTRDYLNTLLDSFRSGAYDQVSFQLADARNSHTNDPERHRGTITGLELADDGLYATAQVTEAGERVLADNPQLGVSARIVENYARSDGKFYPAAIQHVLGTLDPRIPALGSWTPVEMANEGGLIIDLSNSSWQGEPGPSLELAASAVASRLPAAPVSDEFTDIDAVIQATLPPGYASLDMANDGLAEFGRVFELSNEIELARIEQDAEPLPRKSEDRLAYLMSRIGAGTYTPRGYAAYSFASPAQGGVTGMATCGNSDEYGYCMERYHAPGCGSAATPDVVEALRPAMELGAVRPLLDADGQAWADQYGSPMTATDHVEALTGVRVGDASLFETGHARRELAAVQRPQVFGDPDDPDAAPQPFPASTRTTAAAIAVQNGIQTTATAAAQRAAATAEISRQAARYRPPRHPDYAAELSNPAPRESGLAQFGDEPAIGSLPVYSRGA